MRGLTADEICDAFNAGFADDAVQLIGGAEEPSFRPGHRREPARLLFVGDFARSALHEIAHWSLASRSERRMTDYGCRYVPPPRCLARQLQFCIRELEVQALEAVLCRSCAVPFEVSMDDPGNGSADMLRADFASRVARAADRLVHDLPPAAERFIHMVCRRYRPVPNRGTAASSTPVPAAYAVDAG